MHFTTPTETITLAALVSQHPTISSDLRIDRLDEWHNPPASTMNWCFCYTRVTAASDDRA